MTRSFEENLSFLKINSFSLRIYEKKDTSGNDFKVKIKELSFPVHSILDVTPKVK